VRFVTAQPTFPSRTTRSVIDSSLISVGWWTSEPANRANPDSSTWTTASASSASAARQARSASSSARPSDISDANLDVAEATGGGAVGHMRVLARLALTAVRQSVELPFGGSADRVESHPKNLPWTPLESSE